jgi:hypothetical protein
MVATTSFLKGQLFFQPSLFDGSDYDYWKRRMQIFFEAMDFEIWHIIESK